MLCFTWNGIPNLLLHEFKPQYFHIYAANNNSAPHPTIVSEVRYATVTGPQYASYADFENAIHASSENGAYTGFHDAANQTLANATDASVEAEAYTGICHKIHQAQVQSNACKLMPACPPLRS